MRTQLKSCVLRPWELSDAPSVARHANDREIWLHLRDFFPHPYTLADAESWLPRVAGKTPPTALAIEVAGQAAGNISAAIQSDVHRLTAEIGYWIGRAHWGKGIMTEAVGAFTAYLFDTFKLERVFAEPYENSPASCRLLEKNGFVLEGQKRRSVVKDGLVLDQFLYAKTRK